MFREKEVFRNPLMDSILRIFLRGPLLFPEVRKNAQQLELLLGEQQLLDPSRNQKMTLSSNSEVLRQRAISMIKH